MRPRPRPLRCKPFLLPMRLTAGRLIVSALITTGVNPATTGCGTVVFQVGKAVHRFVVAHGVAVDFVHHGLGARLVQLTVSGIVPGQIANRPVPLLVVLARVQLLQALSEFEHEVEFASLVALRFNGFVMPLEQSLRVRETAVFFGVRGGRERRILRS